MKQSFDLGVQGVFQAGISRDSLDAKSVVGIAVVATLVSMPVARLNHPIATIRPILHLKMLDAVPKMTILRGT